MSDDGFPDDNSSGAPFSDWQAPDTSTTPIQDNGEPVQYSGFQPKPFFKALNDILSGQDKANQIAEAIVNAEKNYNTIQAPASDPYEQNADDLKSRKQSGSTPFVEVFVNCHSYSQGQLQSFDTNTGDFAPVPGSETQSQITGFTPNPSYQAGMVIYVAGIGFINILSVTPTTINIPGQINSMGQAFSVFQSIGSTYQISGAMLRYLNDLYGPNWNSFDGGIGSTLPWVTVPLQLSASFLKIDLLPAQVQVPNAMSGSQSFPTSKYNDTVNRSDSNLTGALGPGTISPGTYPSGFSYQSNRQIFVQFDSADAPIIVAKPGRCYYTAGFDTVFITFQTDNGRIRATGGYGDASITDSDTSKLNKLKLSEWPGEEVFNDPYLHPVPFSISPFDWGGVSSAGTAGSINFTSVDDDPRTISQTTLWNAFTVIENRWLPGFENSNASPYLNSSNGVLVGWITGIQFFANSPSTNNYVRAALCVGDPFDKDRFFARRVLWQGSINATGSAGVSLPITFSEPIRFTLQGKEVQNNTFNRFTVPQSWGQNLFVMFSVSGTVNVSCTVHGYTMGNTYRAPMLIQQNIGDFSALSTTISNVVIDPTIDYGFGGYGTNYYIVVNGVIKGRVASATGTTIVLQHPPGFTAIGQVFSVVSLFNQTFRGQTYNVHPYPLDRELEINNT